jgi:hypothetical protein
MVEVFPKVTVAGLSPISSAYTFEWVYGFGRYGEPSDELTGTIVSIPSSDMNLISPPGNAPLKLVFIRRRYSGGSGTVEFNDWADYVVSSENIIAIENHPSDVNNNLSVTVRPNNYIYYSIPSYIYSLAFYKFMTNKVDYAKFGVWSTDDWRMTDGNPFSYKDFSTRSTSYTDLLTIDLLKPITLNKMGFWLGLWVSSGTGYLRCVISEDGSTWNTLFEGSTTSTSEVSVKVPVLQYIRTRYIKLQCYNTAGATTNLRVRELHFWGDYQW